MISWIIIASDDNGNQQTKSIKVVADDITPVLKMLGSMEDFITKHWGDDTSTPAPF